jgi:uncharacterized protein YdeI (YjbR/CyaY-like superfamily)
MKITLSLLMTSGEEWHQWLAAHSSSEKEAWLIFYKGKDHSPCITYDVALDEALCFGWIDSIIQKIDEESYARKFTPRSNTAKWSTVNKRRVARLIREGRMTPAGLARIDDLTEFREDLTDDRPRLPELPEQVEQGLRRSALAWENFNRLPPSSRRNYVLWLSAAKRPETLEKRLIEAIEKLEKNEPLGMK